MIFKINGVVFSSLISRISAIIPTKTNTHIFNAVKFTADDDRLLIQATNGDDIATIEVYPDIYECGVAFVRMEDLKKVAGITDYITVKSDNNVFEIRSDKKSYEVSCYDSSNYEFERVYNIPKVSDEVICSFNENNLVKYLSNLDCIRSKEDLNKILNSFYFDIPNKKMVACDGHRLCVINFACDYISPISQNKMIVSCNNYKNLKSLIGKDKEYSIDVCANNTHLKFNGKFSCGKWSLITKLIDGKYYNYNDLVSGAENNYNYIFSIDCNELKKISNEYNKVCHCFEPMLIYSSNGDTATGVYLDDFKTSDRLNSVKYICGDNEEWYTALNPKYVNDVCSIIDDNFYVKGKYGNKYAMLFYNDTYEIMVLPIKIASVEGVLFTKRQIA